MNGFKNSRKENFLSRIPKTSLKNPKDKLAERCKFNFHYMDFSQPAGQTFEDWEKKNLLARLLNKLKNYSERPLKYWQLQKVGKGKNHILEIYDSFPRKSDFTHPKHVPHQAEWARFRLESTVRLIGFVIPDEYDGKRHEGTKAMFDRNTFYAVFLDKDHKFYKS